MTVFLVLLFGTVVTILFAQLAGARKLGARNLADLRELEQRLQVLEGAAVPVPAGTAPAPASVAAFVPAPVARAIAVPNPRESAPPVESAPPPEAEPRSEPIPPFRVMPGIGDRIAAQLRTGWDQWIAQNLLAAAGGVFVLLGASFFVAVAISNGWLTPWRQVAAALIGGALLIAAGWRAWPADASRRAAHILAQTLVGTGGGVMLLGVVAGARIYDAPLYPSWAGLLGAGAISALVVAISAGWRAQITAALGITTAIAAPLLVDAPPTAGTIAFLLLALAGAGVVIALRGWPWLLQVAIVASLPQPALWALDDRLGDGVSAPVALAIIVAWWALLALPALYFELRADSPRLRMPTSGALFQVAGLAALFGWIEFGSAHATGFEVLLCVLAALHLAAGAVMLAVRRSSQAGAVFVWAIGAALAAGAAAVLLGGAAQPAFWGVETLAMLWLFVRFGDRQAGIAAGLLAALTAGWTLHLAPPDAIASPLAGLTTGALALGALVLTLAGAALLLRRIRHAVTALALATWVALWYLVAVVIVGLVSPVGVEVDQTAQLLVTGAWAALATAAACVAAFALPERLRRHVRVVAEVSLWVVAVKALLLDSLSLGEHEPRMLWLLGALAVLATLLVAIDHRLPRRGSLSLPLAAPFMGVLLVAGLTQPGFDAYRAGTTHLTETLAVLALGLVAAGLALWRSPLTVRAHALVVAVVLAVEALALTTVTLAHPAARRDLRARAARGLGRAAGPRARPAGHRAARAARTGSSSRGACASARPDCSRSPPPSSSPTSPSSARPARRSWSRDSGWVRRWRSRWRCAGCPGSGCSRPRPAARWGCARSRSSRSAPPRALGFGAEHGWLRARGGRDRDRRRARRGRLCARERLRTGAVAGALLVALYGVSVLVVTALTPDLHDVTQAAQLALSVVWTLWGIALLGAGVVRRTPLGLFLRRSGIALAAVAAAKVLIVDTSHFDTAHRAGCVPRPRPDPAGRRVGLRAPHAPLRRRGRGRGARQLRMFTARAVTSTTSTNDESDCTDISSLAQPEMGIVSVGLKAVAFVVDV